MNENEKIARDAVDSCVGFPDANDLLPIFLQAINRATSGLQKELEASDKSLRAAITNSDELSGMNEHLRAQLAAANERVKELEAQAIESRKWWEQTIQLCLSRMHEAVGYVAQFSKQQSPSTPATKEEKR